MLVVFENGSCGGRYVPFVWNGFGVDWEEGVGMGCPRYRGYGWYVFLCIGDFACVCRLFYSLGGRNPLWYGEVGVVAWY